MAGELLTKKRADGSGKFFNQQGFLLMEVVIVAFLMGLLVMASLTIVKDTLARYEMDSASRLLAADLRWLQQQAVNSSGGAMPQLEFLRSGYMVTLETQSIKSVGFPATVSGYFPRVIFSINGTLTEPNPLGATIVLYSLRVSGLKRQIIIDSVGRIRIE